MSRAPTFDEIFAVMSAASVGDSAARVPLPENPSADDRATRFAIALNLLLDDLAFQFAERTRAMEELREREQRLRSIYETAADVIFQLKVEDGRYRFVSINPAFLKITGLAEEQVLGTYVDQIIPEPSLAMVLGKYETAIREQRIVRWEETSDYPTGRLTGEVSVAPVFDENGICTHLVGAVHDVTERKLREQEVRTLNLELEQRVRERTAELEAANAELDAFSYSVAHDLRAPLRSIDGFSQALLEDYAASLDPHAQDYLGLVRQSTQEMAELIEDLLALSRVSRTELRYEQVDLTRIAERVVERLGHDQPERRVEVALAEGLMAEGDSKLLGLVMQNLLSNAWKFTAKRAAPRVELGAVEQDGRTVYFVRDNGAGFDMKYADKLFGVFERLHPVDEYEGTGVGLATVRRIVERHGGSIWAEAQIDRGAAFYFTLAGGEP